MLMKSVRKKGIASLIIGFSMASWISAGINFFVLPISTRIFDPTELASINLFYSVFTLVAWTACLGFDQGYLRFINDLKTDIEKKSLFTMCLAISVAALILFFIFMLPFRGVISLLVVNEENGNLLFFLFICSLNFILLRFLSLFYRIKNAVVLYTVIVVSSSAVIKISYLGAALIDKQVMTAIIFMVITSLFFLILCFALNFKLFNFKRGFRKVIGSKVIRYSIPFMPISLMTILNNDLPLYVLRLQGEMERVGVYSSAIVLAAVVTLLQSGFNTFWGPYVYKNYSLQQFKITQLQSFIVFAIIVFSLLIIMFQDIIVLLVGESYRTVTSFLPFLLFAPVCYTIADTTGVGITLAKKSYINIYIHVVVLLSNLVLCCVLIPLYDVIGASISSAISALILLILKTVIGQRQYRSVEKYWKLIIAVLLFVLVAVLNSMFQGKYVTSINVISLITLFILFGYKKVVTFLIKSN